MQFLVRALAAVATPTGNLAGLSRATVDELDLAWQRLRKGLEHTLAILESNAGITSSKLLASNTSLIPVITHLARRTDKLTADECDALVYWLLAVGIGLRYSAGKETRLAEDLAAIRRVPAVESLLRQSGLIRTRVEILPEDLEGKTTTSPYFSLAYLTCRAAGANDWFHGVALGTKGKGAFKLEYHHVHPRATLKGRSRREINDLSNLAFVSRRANAKISARSPSVYFPNPDDADLEHHFVPRDEHLRTVDRYEDFLVARRALLAEAMTKWIQSFRPTFVTRTARRRSRPAWR